MCNLLKFLGLWLSHLVCGLQATCLNLLGGSGCPLESRLIRDRTRATLWVQEVLTFLPSPPGPPSIVPHVAAGMGNRAPSQVPNLILWSYSSLVDVLPLLLQSSTNGGSARNSLNQNLVSALPWSVSYLPSDSPRSYGMYLGSSNPNRPNPKS